MASLLNVPTELFYYYARYIDLLDFGALLFTCKQLHERLHEDLAFKKCIFDGSPFTFHNLPATRLVQRKFMEFHGKLAVNNNDPDLLLFYFPTLTCDSIVQLIRPVSPELQKKLGRSNLLEQTDVADADKSFVADRAAIEREYVNDEHPYIGDHRKSRIIIDFLFILADQFLKPTTDMEELKRRPERKITLLVLDLFKKFEDHAWVNMIDLNKRRDRFNINITPDGSKGAGSYLKTLFYFQERYPEYKWDINHPIDKVCIRGMFVPSTKHIRKHFTNMTVVDYALFCRDFQMFQFLLTNGGKIPDQFPRIWSEFKKTSLGRYKYGYKRKRMFLVLDSDPRDADSSFLFFYAKNLDGHKDYTNYVKTLIALGARFKENELTEILQTKQTNKYLVIAAKEIRKINAKDD